MMRRPRQALYTGLVASFSAMGCATGGPPAASSPTVPELERRVSVDSTDVGALVLLGAEYRDNGRLSVARETFERALRLEPRNGSATLLLGLTHEDLEAWPEALSVYRSYLDAGPESGQRRDVEDRMRVVRRRMIEETARRLAAGEVERGVSASTVAVFPFAYTGTADEYAPLARALAAMLATDLGVTDRLTVVERLELQLLLDETELGQGPLVDPSTAVTPGRLVGAAQIVQGSFGGDEDAVTLESAIVDVADDPGAVRFGVSNQGTAAQLLDLEKELALALYDALGIELTPAERARVTERWTENVQALLEFGMGLEAADRGDFVEARERYRRAAELDAGFDEAQEAAEETDGLVSAMASGGAAIESFAVGEVELAMPIEPLVPFEGLLLGTPGLVVIPGERDAVTELLGVEGFRPATIRIRIRPPGGGRP